MPPVTSLNTRRQINNVIKRFRFDELESAVIPSFPEISWGYIKSKLVKQHESFTTSNVARIIDDAIDDAKLQESVLKDRLSTLEVIELSRHDKRKIWYGHMLKGLSQSLPYFNKELQSSIKKHFLTLGMEVGVKVTTYDGVTYVSIKENLKRRQVQRGNPFFFAIFLGQRYFFSSKKNVPKLFIEAMTNSMGYTSSKQLKLMGRDLRSLIKLLWARKQGTLNSENLDLDLDQDQTPIYEDTAPIVKPTEIDYTQHMQRKNYAQKCFGKSPPTLELLIINGPDESWKDETVSTKLGNTTMRVTWEFRSHNIATCLTNLIERRVIKTPLPYYISNLMILGKNEITLENS
ncbi:hypothetical protein KM043_001060 [Ampulex compressa]|nr:hypothetical protein KM043_001060 [Ampulex compressa]